MEGGEHYEVERILNHRRKRSGRNEKQEYLIRWKGFGPEEDTWEPEKNLTGCEELLREYLASLREDEEGTELMATVSPTPRKQYTSVLEKSASKTLEAAEIITRRRLQVDQWHKEEESRNLAQEAANGVWTSGRQPGFGTTLPLRRVVMAGSSIILACAATFALYYAGSAETLRGVLKQNWLSASDDSANANTTL
ncbi:chromodomain Y-like protein [Ixodes scapularis]